MQSDYQSLFAFFAPWATLNAIEEEALFWLGQQPFDCSSFSWTLNHLLCLTMMLASDQRAIALFKEIVRQVLLLYISRPRGVPALDTLDDELEDLEFHYNHIRPLWALSQNLHKASQP
jgi:hypothetical protein